MRLSLPSDLASRAAGLALVANLGLMVMKLAVGIITGSVAVLSDGIDSAEDVIASGIALASIRYARRPPDFGHPYGHGRAETIAAMTQAGLITAGAAYIIFRGVDRLIDPPASIDIDLGLASMVIAAVVNLGVLRYVSPVALRTNSPAIAADARHLTTNVVQAAAILVGLLLIEVTGKIEFDGLTALLLALYMLWIVVCIVRESLGDVMDVSLSEDEIDFVRQVIADHAPAVKGYHSLRTRRSGQHRHIDFHITLPPQMTVADSHEVAESIEAAIRKRWPTAVMTIHVEPALESMPARSAE